MDTVFEEAARETRAGTDEYGEVRNGTENAAAGTDGRSSSAEATADKPEDKEGAGSELLKALRERRQKYEAQAPESAEPSDYAQAAEDSTAKMESESFRPTHKTWGLVRSAFEGDDPLSFVADPSVRDRMRYLTRMTKNPEDEERKWALAAYYSQHYRKDIRFCYQNLQALNEKWFEKEGISVEEAFAGIQRSYRGEIDWSGSLGAMWDDTQALAKAGAAKVMKTFANAFYAGLKTATTDPAALAAYTDPEGLAMMNPLVLSDEGKKAYDENVRKGTELVDQMHRDVRKYWGGMAEENSAKVLPEDWFYKWDGGMWLANLDRFLLMEAPSQAVQIYAAYVMGPLGFTLAMGGSSGLDKYYDLEDSGLSEDQKVKNAMLTGLINSGMAWMTAGIVKGKIPGMKEEALLKGNREIVNYFVKAFGIEASQEAVEQLAENAVDIYTGVYGDPEKMSPQEFRKHLWNGVPESALAGGFFGLGAGTVGYRSAREFAGAVEYVDRKARGTVSELEKKETLTDKEAKQLERAKLIVECENPGKKLVLERMNELAFAAEEVEEIRQSEEFKRIMETAEEGTTEEMVIQSILAEREKQIRDMATWNYQDTVDEVEKFAEGIKGTTFHVYFTDQGGSSYGKDTGRYERGERRDERGDAARERIETAEEGENAGSGNTRNTGNTGENAGSEAAEGEAAARETRAGTDENGEVRNGTENAGTEANGREAAARESGEKQKPVGIPDEVWRYMKRKGIENARAFYYNGEVYLNGDRVRPSEVREVLTHEVVGHKGLRAIVGEKRLNELLDEVYREHYQDELFQEVAKRYKLGQEVGQDAGKGARAGTDEYGSSSAEATEDKGELWYSIDDAVNQRIAAEEYLAHLAELGKGSKPSWWREFLQKIRMALSRVHLFRDVKMSDREIETLLARSARAMRKRMLSRRSQVRYEGGGENRYERGEMRDERGDAARERTGAADEGEDIGIRLAYSLEDAVPSKDGYRVERVNEKAGAELNDATAVICEQTNQVFDPAEAPKEGFRGWISQKIHDYVVAHPIPEKCHTPALGNEVNITNGSLRSVANHGGPDAKYNLLPVIPEMLKNAVLVQTENATNADGGVLSKSHILAAKVRYGTSSRYVVAIVIHESDGKFYYDHSLIVLEKGRLGQDSETWNPEKQQGPASHSAQVLNVVRKALLSSGFDAESEKNLRFSIGGAVGAGKMRDAGSGNTGSTAEDAGDAGIGRIGQDRLDRTDRLSGDQTKTENFRRWFGDSQVVDENGEPLVVYRRDDEEFTIFDFDKTQKNDAGWLGKGFYFYGDKDETERSYGYGKNIREFYLRAENPYLISEEEYNELVEADDPQKSDEFTERLKAEGYDSVYWNGDLRQEWMVFEPEQIKSATDNIGTFDPENPDIRFSVAPGDENLVVLHNVSATKLRKAAKLGGLPVPSLAIIDAEKSDFSNYGEISLLADKELIDPKRKGNKVFNADAYSPRAPRTKKFYSDADYDRAAEALKPYDLAPDDDKSVASLMGKYKDGIYDSDLEYKLSETYAVLNWYCQEHGIETPSAENWKEVIHIQSSSEFNQWWNEVALPNIGLDPEEKMFAGTTISGNSRWIPLTLENVVKAMTKKVRNGEGFNYGIGNIRSLKAVQFKSVAQIQSQRDHIVSTKEMKAVKDEIQSEFNELAERMRSSSSSKYGWDFNTGEDCLMAMAEGGRENIEYLRDRFGDNSEILREMATFLDKLANLPTEYFEAKPQRAVGLEEFKAAVIPANTPADVRKILEDAGVMIYTYNGREERKTVLQVATQENDLRFMLSDYSEADIRDIVAILRPFAGTFVTKNPKDYSKYLAEHGVKDIPEKDAFGFAAEAARQNNAEARKRAAKRRDDWIYENNPLWQMCVDFCGGTEFKIKPAFRFQGEDFSGTWISPEFVKYSEKRPQGKKESDASYQKYLKRREAALKKADGMASDQLAEAIARKTGRDALEVEQEIIDYFRDLKKPDLYRAYTQWKEEELASSKEERERMFDEYMRQEQARIEDEAVEVLQRGQPIDLAWIDENREVYKELYRQLFPDKEKAPFAPGKADLEAINAALMQEGSNAADYAKAYKEARIASWREYMEALRKFRDKVMQSKADAIRLQRDALDFAEKYLRPEERGEFARDIVRLLEYSTMPSGKYPDGRRMHEFQALLKRMTERAGDVRKEARLAEIREMLDAVKVKRNYKGIPTSVLPSEQGRVDRIRQIVEMNLAALSNMIVYNNEQIELLEDDPEKLGIREKYLEDNALLEMFGNLEARSADEVEAAAKELKKLIEGGKLEYREKLKQRKAELEEWQRQAVQDATFGKGSYMERGDAKGHSGYWLKNENLGTLMRLVSGGSMQDFDKSVHGLLYRNVEDSTQKEQTALRRMQQDLDEALGRLAGVTGKTAVERMRKKGKFYRMVSKVVEHSGVFKKEYSRMTKLNVLEEGRRGLEKSSIPVEDYEWQGKMYPGARSLLREIDNGGKASWHGRPLDEMAVAFLRQQLADYDTGLKNSYEIFHDEADDANFNRMLEEERESGRLMVIHPLAEEYSETVEVPLSQGQALQILLTWEQEHYQANMKWNGWTEESIKQLRAFIKPEALKMGYWMREYIAQKKAELDAKVFERYGAHLPENEKYFPGAFRGSRAKKVKVESELGRGAGSLSINPSFLIARKFHLNPVDTEADAFSSFLGNQIEQEHFLAWSDTIRDLKGVYGSSAVQKAISDNFGRAVADNLVERISTIAAGGGKYNGEFAARLFSKLYRYWVPAKIALKPSSAVKQILGSLAYMNRVPVSDFVVNMSKANFMNREYREFVRWAKETDYLKNRLAGGLDKDLQFLLNYTRDSHAYSPFTDALMQAGTWQTRWADKWSTLHGGFAAYQYALKQAKKSGMTESEAIGAARRAWMRWTDETQQSGYLKDQNYFQANQGAFRYLTAFMSNPIQVMNLQLQTMNEIRYGKNKKEAWGKFGRQILVNHLVVPTLMQFTVDMFRHGFDVPEWWDEVELEDYLLAWGLGSFEAAFLYGKLLQTIVQSTYRWGRGVVAIPLLDDLEQDIRSTKRMVTTDKELTEKDLMDGIKTVGDVGMLMGTADSRVGSLGAILSALGAQGKQIVRWFEEER